MGLYQSVRLALDALRHPVHVRGRRHQRGAAILVCLLPDLRLDLARRSLGLGLGRLPVLWWSRPLALPLVPRSLSGWLWLGWLPRRIRACLRQWIPWRRRPWIRRGRCLPRRSAVVRWRWVRRREFEGLSGRARRQLLRKVLRRRRHARRLHGWRSHQLRRRGLLPWRGRSRRRFPRWRFPRRRPPLTGLRRSPLPGARQTALPATAGFRPGAGAGA